MTSLLDEDSFYIDKWEDVAKEAFETNRVEEFKKKISDYIYLTNSRVQKEIDKYINKRLGDFQRQELCEKLGKIYVPD